MSQETQGTKYIVQTSAARMPSSCWGQYRNVAVLKVENWVEEASMISERAKGVLEITAYWGKLHSRGKNTAFAKALKEAQELCERLNAQKQRTERQKRRLEIRRFYNKKEWARRQTGLCVALGLPSDLITKDLMLWKRLFNRSL